jgi:hypothetical protein
MKISEFYTNEAIIEGFGRGRTRKVIAELREVWPDFLGERKEVLEAGGRSPYFYKEVNPYYAAWVLFILSNCKSHSREDVVKAVLRGTELKRKVNEEEELFIIWFGNLLSDPERIKRDIRSIVIFFDADNMVSVFTEQKGTYNGDTLLFHGKSPAFKIRHSAALEKDFLVEIAELIYEPELVPDWSHGENNEIVDDDGNVIGIQKGNEVFNPKGKLVARIDGCRLIRI